MDEHKSENHTLTQKHDNVCSASLSDGQMYKQGETSEGWNKLYIEGVEELLAPSNKKNMLKYTDEKVNELCEQLGVDCHISLDGIFVRTNCGQWKICMDENLVTGVYHKNSKNGIGFSKLNKGKEDVYQRYHKQDIGLTDFYEVLRYIKKHDKSLLHKEYPNPVDKALQQNKNKHYMKLQ